MQVKTETFLIGDHQCELQMFTDDKRGRSYEIRVNGEIFVERKPWPLGSDHKLLSEQELIESKKAWLAELKRREEEAEEGRNQLRRLEALVRK